MGRVVRQIVALGILVFVGLLSACTAQALPAGNLLANASFESGTTGWTSYNGSITSVADSGAPDGTHVARVQYTGADNPADGAYTLGMDNWPGVSVIDGMTYTAQAWVKADQGSVNKPVFLNVREWNGTTYVGSSRSSVQLSSAWTPVSVNYTVQRPGDTIDVYLSRESGATGGERFRTDAVTLVANPIPPNNLLSNSSFESGSAGWGSYNGSATSIAASDAPDGSYVENVAYTGADNAGDPAYTLGMDSWPGVGATAGQTYAAQAWVRGNPAAISRQVFINIREWNGTTFVGARRAAVQLTSHWEPVQVKYAVQHQGDTLDVYLSREGGATSGESFQVDALSLAVDGGSSSCPLGTPGSTIGMTVTGCRTIASDTSTSPDPSAFWSSIDCQNSTRAAQLATGGDAHTTASGGAQGDTNFREMTVLNGDNFSGFRCELGYNWASADDSGRGIQGPGATVLYYEGQRRVTFASIRLGHGIDPAASMWRVVLQMKQTQPYFSQEPGNAFELQVRDGKWIISANSQDLWTAPAAANSWTRWAFDITYSSDPSIGQIKAYVDLNGDGNFTDPGEQSPVFHTSTLRAEQAGGPSRYSPGEPIPSHLRAGLYQNPAYNCPTGCSVGIDNVQVMAP